jgi:hypothetical protein
MRRRNKSIYEVVGIRNNHEHTYLETPIFDVAMLLVVSIQEEVVIYEIKGNGADIIFERGALAELN